MTLFCSTLILAKCGLTRDQAVRLFFLFGRRPPSFFEKRSPDSRFFLVRIKITGYYSLQPRNQVWILIIRNWPIFSLLFVFESKVPHHAFLGATKKKMEFCLYRRLVTESYSRNRGKQNGAIVIIFSFITIILVFKSRKQVLKPLLSRGCFHRLAGFYKRVSVILL